MRRFEQRGNETLVVAELFERPVQVRTDEGVVVDATVEDVGIEQLGTRGWAVARAFVRTGASRGGLGRLGRRRGETLLVPIEDVVGLREPTDGQSAIRLLEAYEDLKPADLAEVIHDLSPRRRAEVAAALDDDRLADVIEELPEDDQVEILGGPGGRPRRRRARGDGARRRRRPARRAAQGAPGGAAPEDGARRGRRPAPPAHLRREHRRWPDDDRAGHPRPRGLDRRGAGRGAPGRAVDRAGLAPSSSAASPLETPTGRYLGHGPHPAAAARAAARAHRRHPRQGRRAAAARRDAGPGGPDAGDLQPGRAARRRRRGPPARRGHRRRRARPHPSRGLARGAPRRA